MMGDRKPTFAVVSRQSEMAKATKRSVRPNEWSIELVSETHTHISESFIAWLTELKPAADMRASVRIVFPTLTGGGAYMYLVSTFPSTQLDNTHVFLALLAIS